MNERSVTQQTQAKQAQQHEHIVLMLHDIHQQNTQMLGKVDDLEEKIAKRAVVAGGIAGALSGGIGGTVVTVGIELIKAKFGG